MLFESSERLVQPVADLVVELIAQRRPASLRWHEERIVVVVGVVGPLLSLLLRAALRELVLDDQPALLVEHIARPLQKQRAEDVFLELRRIHLPPQDVRGSKQMPFKLRQRQHEARVERPARACATCVTTVCRNSPPHYPARSGGEQHWGLPLSDLTQAAKPRGAAPAERQIDSPPPPESRQGGRSRRQSKSGRDRKNEYLRYTSAVFLGIRPDTIRETSWCTEQSTSEHPAGTDGA